MTVGELVQRLRAIPDHYVVKIWDDDAAPEYWSEKLTGKLIAVDEIAIVPEE